MATRRSSSHSHGGGTKEGGEPSKAELQRELEETRESISETVEEIKETVTEQYESLKDTATSVLDLREEFHREPLVWALGALSAGFALGYTLGYAHKNTRSGGRGRSQAAAFADSLVQELSTVGNSLVMPALNSRIRQLFGFDISELLEEIGGARKGSAKKGREKGATKRLGPRKAAKQKGAGRKRGG